MPLLPFRLGKIGKTNLAWVVITIAGVSSFVVAKDLVTKQRYENMRARQRMKESNLGEYEPSSRKFTV
jgi:hypothetical protein